MARNNGKNCTNYKCTFKVADHLERRQEHQSVLKDPPDTSLTIPVFPCYKQNIDIQCRSIKKNPCNRNEMPQKNSWHAHADNVTSEKI